MVDCTAPGVLTADSPKPVGGVTSIPIGGDSFGIGVVATLDPGVRTACSVILDDEARSGGALDPRKVYRRAAFSRLSSYICCRSMLSTGMSVGGMGTDASVSGVDTGIVVL